jgi:hypothetical protein
MRNAIYSRGIVLTILVILGIRTAFFVAWQVLMPISHTASSTALPPIRIVRGRQLVKNVSDERVADVFLTPNASSLKEGPHETPLPNFVQLTFSSILFVCFVSITIFFTKQLITQNSDFRDREHVEKTSCVSHVACLKIVELELSSSEQLARLQKLCEF